MEQPSVSLSFQRNEVYQVGAALLVLLACPIDKSDRAGELHASLCAKASLRLSGKVAQSAFSPLRRRSRISTSTLNQKAESEKTKKSPAPPRHLELLESRHVRYFLAVVEERRFTRAVCTFSGSNRRAGSGRRCGRSP